MKRTHKNVHKEYGGVTILVAVILLAVAMVVGMGLGRTSLREILITGNESTGRKAYETADSGLDWVITWGSPYANRTGKPAEVALQNKMQGLLNAIDMPTENARDDYSDATGTLLFQLLAKDYSNSSLNPPRSSGWLQTESVVNPSFDVEIRYLGSNELENTGKSALIKNNRSLWLVRSTGRSNISGTNQSFISRREAVVEYIN